MFSFALRYGGVLETVPLRKKLMPLLLLPWPFPPRLRISLRLKSKLQVLLPFPRQRRMLPFHRLASLEWKIRLFLRRTYRPPLLPTLPRSQVLSPTNKPFQKPICLH